MSNSKMSRLASTTMFVLLWSSGAIVCEIGIRHGSPFALLLVRYALALAVLTAVALRKRQLLPEPGSRVRVAITGFAIAGVYSSFYLLALDRGITPGVLATILGVQPILTGLITERRIGPARLLGLTCALAGLALVVHDGLSLMRFDGVGLGFAALALLGLLAFLMVSTWRYPSFKDLNLMQPRSPLTVVLLGSLIYLVWNFSQPVLLGLSIIYVGSGIVIRLGGILRRRLRPHPPAPTPSENQVG